MFQASEQLATLNKSNMERSSTGAAAVRTEASEASEARSHGMTCIDAPATTRSISSRTAALRAGFGTARRLRSQPWRVRAQ